MNKEACWTQIANGYNEAIYAKVTTNIDDEMCTRLQDLVNSARQLGISDKGLSGVNQTKELGNSLCETLKFFYQTPGFVKIHPGKHTDFLMSGQDGKVFVTVKTKSEVVADNYPIANNRGIVVDRHGCVYKSRPGTVWSDQYGNDHTPFQERNRGK